ncbi:PDR/VanB family oxidoreductase [Paraburkholderia sp. J63]|uniref:PDR/VanB family oxidoreductase n=1 Tax=Paraburkholderia sp. J63 TaxID=2805434 RepID=UPI002ABDDA66|nr:PDR/VanB family oxidoreductase [Paraburkholderia sp. J63]
MSSMFTVRIMRKVQESSSVCSLELAAPDGSPLPAFEAGAHVDLEVTNGLIRQYSLCNSPLESHRYVVGVLLDPASRGGSRAVHDLLLSGDCVRISEPRNHFALASHARHSVLIAGGIGVTPLLAMAEQLHATQQPFALHYFARTAADFAFRERLRDAPYAAHCRFHETSRLADRASTLAAALGAPADGTHAYLCGPDGFIDALLGLAERAGWRAASLHTERFGKARPNEGDAAFDVQIASSGTVCHVLAGQSVVEALEAIGVEVPVSCEQGVCGMCLTGVLAGRPDHRDTYLTHDERARNNQFTPCCSRALDSLLVLDL